MRMSLVQIMSTVCSNVDGPMRVSRSRPAISGSSSADWIVLSRVSHAPTGSSSAGGIGGASMSHVSKKNAGSQPTRWPTTSRATHPSHGAGLSQASSGTACTRWVNAPATFRYRSEISLITCSFARLDPRTVLTTPTAGTHRC
jgi:hypothetical protein